MTQIISVTINLKSNKNKKHKRAVKPLVLWIVFLLLIFAQNQHKPPISCGC
jgi:hypothetical protein